MALEQLIGKFIQIEGSSATALLRVVVDDGGRKRRGCGISRWMGILLEGAERISSTADPRPGNQSACRKGIDIYIQSRISLYLSMSLNVKEVKEGLSAISPLSCMCSFLAYLINKSQPILFRSPSPKTKCIVIILLLSVRLQSISIHPSTGLRISKCDALFSVPFPAIYS